MEAFLFDDALNSAQTQNRKSASPGHRRDRKSSARSSNVLAAFYNIRENIPLISIGQLLSSALLISPYRQAIVNLGSLPAEAQIT